MEFLILMALGFIALLLMVLNDTVGRILEKISDDDCQDVAGEDDQ